MLLLSKICLNTKLEQELFYHLLYCSLFSRPPFHPELSKVKPSQGFFPYIASKKKLIANKTHEGSLLVDDMSPSQFIISKYIYTHIHLNVFDNWRFFSVTFSTRLHFKAKSSRVELHLSHGLLIHVLLLLLTVAAATMVTQQSTVPLQGLQDFGRHRGAVLGLQGLRTSPVQSQQQNDVLSGLNTHSTYRNKIKYTHCLKKKLLICLVTK